MEFFLLFIVIFVAFFIWQYIAYQRDMKIKAAFTDFLSRIIICKVEQRDGQFYLYEEISKKFIAQGKTPQEVQDNLPMDNGKFYLAEDGHREIKEELECMQLKST
jgi:hypothetical protein